MGPGKEDREEKKKLRCRLGLHRPPQEHCYEGTNRILPGRRRTYCIFCGHRWEPLREDWGVD